jgi:hypothetical protein
LHGEPLDGQVLPAPLLLPELPPLPAPVLQNQVPGLSQLHVPAFAYGQAAPTT